MWFITGYFKILVSAKEIHSRNQIAKKTSSDSYSVNNFYSLSLTTCTY